MNVLVTYDIVENVNHQSKNSEIKKTMIENGYLESFTPSGDTTSSKHYLPTYSLVKVNTTPEQAKIDLDAAIRKHGATLARFFAAGFEQGKYSAIPGRQF